MKVHLNNRKGFTMVEILVVVALTVLVMGLVFYPLTQSFSLTRNAEVRIRTQDDARFALSIISRDLADAMYVYDNTEDTIDFTVPNSITGVSTTVPVRYAKIDLVLPRMHGYCTADAVHVAGPREFPRHNAAFPTLDEAAPTCPIDGTALELRPVQPLTPDTKIVRYFIGLRDPNNVYTNGYMKEKVYRLTGNQQDNMFILYRAEFSPTDTSLFAGKDANANLSKSNFFYDPAYSPAWMAISRPIVVPENTDLIKIEFNGSGVPTVTPTVRFTPTAVKSDRLSPVKEAGDDPEHGDAVPTRYKATYGHWVLPYEITVDPFAGRLASDNRTHYYFVAPDALGNMCIYKQDSAGETPVFNIDRYVLTRDGPDPTDPTWIGYLYGVGNVEPDKPELAFTVDTMKGTVNCAFPVVNDNVYDPNLTALLGGTAAVSKRADTDVINTGCTALTPYRRLTFNEIINERILLNSTVVRGSVKVIAPNATTGSDHDPLLYSRLPYLLNDPGKNQYTVDYDYDNPIQGAAAVYFHSLQTTGDNWGEPLPSSTENVLLYYEVQNNKKGDVFRASYTTKELITVIVGIRVYDSGSGKPAQFQLSNKIRLRNIKT